MVRWLWSALYGSTPAEFVSAYGLEESVERLAAATKRSVVAALFQQAAVGKVTAQSVSLQRLIPFVGNPSRPSFFGTFRHVGDQVRLIGRFTIHPAIKVMFSIVVGFWLLWTLMVLVLQLRESSPDGWFLVAIGAGGLLAIVGTQLLGKWLSRHDIAWLSGVIEEALR